MKLYSEKITKVVDLLKTKPIAEVKRETKLSYITLARLAKIHLEH